jgi:DNA-binding transcriptional ArsR family regulator
MNSNTQTDSNEYLKAIDRRLQSLERRVEEIESSFNPIVEDKVALYLTVPDSLRKSLFAVSALSKATADEVCIKTGRHRSIENKYLNELVRAGWLKRERIGKKVYYSYLKKKGEESAEVIGSIDELDKKLEEILS